MVFILFICFFHLTICFISISIFLFCSVFNSYYYLREKQRGREREKKRRKRRRKTLVLLCYVGSYVSLCRLYMDLISRAVCKYTINMCNGAYMIWPSVDYNWLVLLYVWHDINVYLIIKMIIILSDLYKYSLIINDWLDCNFNISSEK